jgi:hypothetical protein
MQNAEIERLTILGFCVLRSSFCILDFKPPSEFIRLPCLLSTVYGILLPPGEYLCGDLAVRLEVTASFALEIVTAG